MHPRKGFPSEKEEKTMKKLLTVFLVLVLLSGLAAGCGNQNTGSISSGSAASEIASEAPSPASSGESSTGETQNTPDNVVTIDIYVPGEETASSLDNTVGKYIADRFGLEFMLYGYPGDSVELSAAWAVSPIAA